jgi:activator-of-BECN1-regulated-autophagy protein 1
MELVRVLPSAEDEINAACFHPRPGGGIAYGTKEGRLRVISLDRSALAEDPAERAEAAGEAGSAPSGAAGSGSGSGSGAAGARGEAEQHPSQRELDSLRQWVMTQQWLQQQALGGGGMLPGGGAPPPAPM